MERIFRSHQHGIQRAGISPRFGRQMLCPWRGIVLEVLMGSLASLHSKCNRKGDIPLFQSAVATGLSSRKKRNVPLFAF